MKMKRITELSIFILSLLVFIWLKFDYRLETGKQSLNFADIELALDANRNVIYGDPTGSTEQTLHYTGYSSGYDYDTKNSLWVSYNLQKRYFEGRKYVKNRKFKPSPDIKRRFSAELDSYKKTGYDRGHLAKQEDMKGRNRNCELEACYLNNVSPQLKNFNRGIWKNLEDQCQEWLLGFDEGWVITGPVFDSQKELLKNDLEIPDAFYKILVLRKKDNLEFRSFLIPHINRKDDSFKYQTSIDEVEKVTNLDFFPLMDDSLENIIEKRETSLDFY